MKHLLHRSVAAAAILALSGGAIAQTAIPGSEEFGMNERELVAAVEKVEALITACMREQGFEYVAADYRTVRKAMASIMALPGMEEEEFIEAHGFGISTLYTGGAPQLVNGYSPARVGLGDRNVDIFKNLSPADQVAYNRALLGDNAEATFAVGLDIENFSQCGGCTRKALEQVFSPDQLKESYYNPRDALIKNDPRMRAAFRQYADEMRSAGFDYTDPEEVEADIRARLDAITGGGTIPVGKLSPEQIAALKKLQERERKVAALNLKLEEELFDEVEEKIEKELFARPVK